MFRRLGIGTKLILGFIFIAALTGFVSILVFQEFNKLHTPLAEGIPQALKEIEQTSSLDSLIQKMLYYDQILTDSVRNYVRTGNRKWKYRYQDSEPQLDKTLKEAVAITEGDEKTIFEELQKAKTLYDDSEFQAIEAMDEGGLSRAQELLNGVVYWQLKERFKENLKSYETLRAKKRSEASLTSSRVDVIVQKTNQLASKTIRILIVLAGFILIIAIACGYAFSRLISKPLRLFQEGAQIIGQGNPEYRIELKSNDEFGRLALAFNEMAFKLQESRAGLQDKIREKERDLAESHQKIEQEKARYDALLTSVKDGLVAVNRHGKVMMMNQPALDMLGYDLKEMIDQPFHEIIQSESEKQIEIPFVKRPGTIALATGKKISSTAYYYRKNKEKFPVALTISPVVLSGEIIGAIEIFRDITREKIDREVQI